MKKIGAIVIIMLVIVFLSWQTGKVEKKSLSGVSKEQIVLEKNKDKYNKHIRFYNRILNVDKGLLYYFEDAGMDKKFKNIQTEDIEADIAIDKNFIDKLKELSTSKEKKDELDKKAIAMIPILEKMLPVVEEMRTYYKNKQYLQDNYAKAQTLHSELLASLDKYNQVTKSYKEVFEKKSNEIKKLMIKENNLLHTINLYLLKKATKL